MAEPKSSSVEWHYAKRHKSDLELDLGEIPIDPLMLSNKRLLFFLHTK